MLVSTLEAYFQGKKDLFKGLAMERSDEMHKSCLAYTTMAALLEQAGVVSTVQDSWRSKQEIVLCMTSVLGRSSFFFVVMADVVIIDVDVAEVDVVADVTAAVVAVVVAADTEDFVGSGWYAAEGIGLELELK